MDYMNLTFAWDDTNEVWEAYLGPDREASRWVGEGRDREDAAIDYWWQARAGYSEGWVNPVRDDWGNKLYAVETMQHGWEREEFQTIDEAINFALDCDLRVQVVW